MTLRRLLSPATALMGRLTYARKFVLIGLVLLVPAGVALKAYWDQQGVQIAFSAKERVGDAYLEPARDLVTRVVEARGLAVRAAAGDSQAASALPGKLRLLDASVAAVGKADASMGSELETTKLWNELEGDIAKAKAAKPRSPQAAFDAWTAATSGATGLIVQVSNGSNLILDPDLDTFYLMDALITKLPAIVDNAGQASDLQVIVAHEGTIAQRIALAGAQGTLRSTASAMNDGYKTSFTHTADGTLTTLGGPLGSTLKAGEAVAAGVDPTGKGAVDEAAAAARGAKAIAAATSLEQATLPKLDALIAVRIAKFESARDRIALIIGVALLVALYLFVGFFLSVRGAVAEISGRLRGLTERDTTDLRAGLEAVAAGDLTVEVDADHAADRAHRPRRARRRRRRRQRDPRQHRRARSRPTTTRATRWRRRSAQRRRQRRRPVRRVRSRWPPTSDEAGRAVGEIAAAVGDVAHGAERQVRMVESTRETRPRGRRAAASRAPSRREETAAAAEHAARSPHDGVGAAAAGDRRDARRSPTPRARSSDAIGELSRAHRADRRHRRHDHRHRRADQPARAQRRDRGRPRRRAGPRLRRRRRGGPQARRGVPARRRARSASLIGEIQTDTAHIVDVVEAGAERTDDGVATVEQVRAAFEQIGESVDDVTARVEEIAGAITDRRARRARRERHDRGRRRRRADLGLRRGGLGHGRGDLRLDPADRRVGPGARADRG